MQTTKLDHSRTERMALVRQLRDLRVALGLAMPWTRPQRFCTTSPAPRWYAALVR